MSEIKETQQQKRARAIAAAAEANRRLRRDRRIKELVAEAPALTTEQRHNLAAIFLVPAVDADPKRPQLRVEYDELGDWVPGVAS